MGRAALVLMTVGAAGLTSYFVADYLRYNDAREQASIELGEHAGIRVAEALDAKLFEISARAREYAVDVASVDSQGRLLESIERESLRFPLVLGVTVAFEPGAFAGKESIVTSKALSGSRSRRHNI